MLVIRLQKFSDIDIKYYESISFKEVYGLNLHPDWLLTYLEEFNLSGNECFLELYDHEDQSIKGILPMVKKEIQDNRFFKFNKLVPCGQKPSDFFPLYVEINYEKIFAKLLAEWLKKNNELWDILYINYIPSTNRFWKEIVQELEMNNFNVKVNTNQEFLFINTNNDYNDLLGEIGSKKAKYLRYISRRFEREVGEIEFFEPMENINIYFEEFLSQYSNVKKIFNQSDPFIRIKELKQFMEQIINRYQKNRWIRFIAMQSNGENIAFCYYFEFNGIIYYSMPSYDISYSKYSPGTILLNYLIKKSFDNPNIFEFNFMRSVYDYKLWWKPSRQNYVEISVRRRLDLRYFLNKIFVKIRSII